MRECLAVSHDLIRSERSQKSAEICFCDKLILLL